MAAPKLSKLELRIMEILWTKGDSSIREIHEAFPPKGRQAYTTIQTTVYRMEGKKAVTRVKKIGNSHIFAAAVTRNATRQRLAGDLLVLLGGRIQPVVAYLIQSRKFTLDDVKEARKLLDEHARKEESE
jgi:BlaI family penicillinase repressor